MKRGWRVTVNSSGGSAPGVTPPASYSYLFAGGTPGDSVVGAFWEQFNISASTDNVVINSDGSGARPFTPEISTGVQYINGPFAQDQWSRITMASVADFGGFTSFPSVNARASGNNGTSTCYRFNWFTSGFNIGRVINQVYTTIGANVAGPVNLAPGDTMEIQVSELGGNIAEIRGYYNSVLQLTRTHNHGGGTLANGRGAWESFWRNANPNYGISLWEGGDLP